MKKISFRAVSTVMVSFSILGLFVWLNEIQAQQNNTLFFMHSVPEANFVNPAVQIQCPVFIGLPMISSLHVNFANSGFRTNKLINFYSDGTFGTNDDLTTSNFPNRKYAVTEAHAVILALGIMRNNIYYNFSITEKNNGRAIYTADLVSFALRGDNEFVGQQVDLKGTRVSINHYREYALGMAKRNSSGLTWGIKAKLLFGKYNFATLSGKYGITIDETSRDVLFDLDLGYNSSLPYALTQQAPGVYRYSKVYDTPLLKQLMNNKNPGFAFDVGFIYEYSKDWTFSGSLLDLGLIRYRSNLSNYSLDGHYRYQGPFGDGEFDENYTEDLFDELHANMNESVTASAYTYFLDPRLYLGASRKLQKMELNFLWYNRFMPGKIQTGTTVSLLASPLKSLKTSISWSYMNNSVANIGLGLAFGNHPLQIYAVTDNIIGIIMPASVKNVNARIGLNLILGCNKRTSGEDLGNNCGCFWLQQADEKKSLKDKLMKGKAEKPLKK